MAYFIFEGCGYLFEVLVLIIVLNLQAFVSLLRLICLKIMFSFKH
ncbi:MAG: hypothetical protein UHX91_04020 [Methanosphaera sp.]|nr:hypothetical protein [Methanosphaera sp.]